MFKTQGAGKGTTNDPTRMDGAPSADIPNAKADVGLHRSGKEKTVQKLVMIQVPISGRSQTQNLRSQAI
jgi:hypothetical protein